MVKQTRQNLLIAALYTGFVILMGCAEKPTGANHSRADSVHRNVHAPMSVNTGSDALSNTATDSNIASPPTIPLEKKVSSTNHISTNHTSKYLVWVRGMVPRSERTFELRLADGKVEPVEEQPGIHMWYDGAPAEIQRRKHKVPRCHCDFEAGEEICTPGETNEIESIALITPRGARVLYAAPTESAAKMDDVEHSVAPLATIGNSISFETGLYVMSPCAAHGYFASNFVWVDLGTGKAIDMLQLQPPPQRIRTRLFNQICDEFVTCQTSDEDDAADTERIAILRDGCKPEVLGLEPLWTMNGFVRRYIGGTSAPYFCANGGSAYMVTSRFGALSFEGPLQSAAQVLPEISAFVKTLERGTSLGGITPVP